MIDCDFCVASSNDRFSSSAAFFAASAPLLAWCRPLAPLVPAASRAPPNLMDEVVASLIRSSIPMILARMPLYLSAAAVKLVAACLALTPALSCAPTPMRSGIPNPPPVGIIAPCSARCLALSASIRARASSDRAATAAAFARCRCATASARAALAAAMASIRSFPVAAASRSVDLFNNSWILRSSSCAPAYAPLASSPSCIR